MKVLSSNSENIKVNSRAEISPATRKTWAGGNLIFKTGLFASIGIPLSSISTEELAGGEFSSASKWPSLGLVGTALLLPIAGIAGALSGDKKKIWVFALYFSVEGFQHELVIETTSYADSNELRELAYALRAA